MPFRCKKVPAEVKLLGPKETKIKSHSRTKIIGPSRTKIKGHSGTKSRTKNE